MRDCGALVLNKTVNLETVEKVILRQVRFLGQAQAG